MQRQSAKNNILFDDKANFKIKNFGIVALLLISILAVLSFSPLTPVSAAQQKYEDFEDITDWTNDGEINAVRSTWTKHAGTYSLKCKDTDTGEGIELINGGYSIDVSALTLKGWFYYNSTGTLQGIAQVKNYTSGTCYGVKIQLNNTPFIQYDLGGGVVNIYSANTTLTPGVWYNFTFIMDAGALKFYINDSLTVSTSIADSDDAITRIEINGAADSKLHDIFIDDLYLYDSCEYPGASSSSTSAEQCYYNVTGTDTILIGIIDWSGEANTSVWSNNTAISNGGNTMYINISVNDTWNCTDIYLDFNDTDMVDSGNDSIEWENIHVEIRNAADGSWSGVTYDIDDDVDGNVSFSDIWSTCGRGTNPFNITNTTSNPTPDCRLEVRFYLEIPLVDADTYTAPNISWKLSIKTELTGV